MKSTSTDITVTNAHGTFTARPTAVDVQMQRCLPASPLDLQGVLSTYDESIDWSDIHSVSEALVMIASLWQDAAGYR